MTVSQAMSEATRTDTKERRTMKAYSESYQPPETAPRSLQPLTLDAFSVFNLAGFPSDCLKDSISNLCLLTGHSLFSALASSPRRAAMSFATSRLLMGPDGCLELAGQLKPMQQLTLLIVQTPTAPLSFG